MMGGPGEDANSPLMIAFSKSILFIICFSVLLLPSFEIIHGQPFVRIEDFLLPLIVFLLWKTKSFRFDAIAKATIVFAIYILLSMAINERINQPRDYFEIYKLAKFLLIYFFLLKMAPLINWKKWSYIFLIPLLLFNVFQYFDCLNFNSVIEPFYSRGVQLEFFGLNSLGEPATKRLLGTMGNPNNNAIFMFGLLCFFIPEKNFRFRQVFSFLLVFLFFLSCQSRTILAGLIFIFPAIYFLQNKKRDVIIIIACMTMIAAGYFFFDAQYLTSLSSAKVLETHSVEGRFEIWSRLWKMILQKPLFGHAPFKEYFYSNILYSESQYILWLWRYGFIGIVVIGYWLLVPLLKSWREKDTPHQTKNLVILFGLAVSALTNNPFEEPRLLVIFAAACACAFAVPNEKTIAGRI